MRRNASEKKVHASLLHIRLRFIKQIWSRVESNRTWMKKWIIDNNPEAKTSFMTVL